MSTPPEQPALPALPRNRDDRDYQPRRRPHRRPFSPETLGNIGIAVLLCGALLTAKAIFMDTSVPVGGDDRVHNLGKLSVKVCNAVAGVGLSVVGAIFFAASRLIEAIRPTN